MIRGKWVVSPDYKDSYIEVLTENLLPLRTKAEITQEELSAMVGISRQTYYAIETRRRQMSWNTYLSLILFFDTNVATHSMLKKDKWVNRSISCPEYVQSIYKMMNWNKECRYKIYGRLANSERGLVLVFDLASAVMFDPLPEEYFDKHTGKMKKRIVKYYPDEIRMKLGRSYSDYEALQQRSSFESLSGYMDTSGGAVPATVSEELAASISMQEQEKKRETLFGTIIGNGGDDDVRNNE